MQNYSSCQATDKGGFYAVDYWIQDFSVAAHLVLLLVFLPLN